MDKEGIKDIDYIVDAKMIKALDGKFNSDFYTNDFNPADLGEYLCAQAYGLVGKEMFYDSKLAPKISEMKQAGVVDIDKQFIQGMATYSVLEKVATAKRILSSEEFEKTQTINMKDVSKDANDYATQAFVLYYAYTQGYHCDWNSINHEYSALNFDSRPNVEFKNVENKTAPAILIEEVNRKLGLNKVENATV